MITIEKILSRDNRRLAAVRKVRDGVDRDRMFVEGKRLAWEAINSGISIDEAYLQFGFPDTKLVEAILHNARFVAEVPEKIFKTIKDTDDSQGVILIAKKPTPACSFSSIRISADTCKLPLLVYLKEPNNPSNLGAIIRTSEAAGVAGIVVSPRSADAYSPKALRASMGSSFRMDVWTGVEFDQLVSWARTEGIRLVATSPRSARSHTEIDWTCPTALVFGSEAHGLSDNELGEAAELVTIEIEDSVESLNLAVSVGVILFEARRQNLR